MPGKTEKKFRLPLLILVTVLAGTLLIFLGSHFRDKSYGQEIIRVTNAISVPAMEIQMMNVLTNIFEFGGDDIDRERKIFSYAAAAAGVLILFLISPFLLFRSYATPNKKGTFGWYAGAVILSLGVFFSTSVIVNTLTAETENAESITQKNREKNQLRMQLMNLAFEAAEAAVLPGKFGGGSGSFKNFPDGNGNEPREIQLSDLSSSQAAGQLYHFEITDQVTDSAIVISGSFTHSLSDTPETLAVKVTPHEPGAFQFIRN